MDNLGLWKSHIWSTHGHINLLSSVLVADAQASSRGPLRSHLGLAGPSPPALAQEHRLFLFFRFWRENFSPLYKPSGELVICLDYKSGSAGGLWREMHVVWDPALLWKGHCCVVVVWNRWQIEKITDFLFLQEKNFLNITSVSGMIFLCTLFLMGKRTLYKPILQINWIFRNPDAVLWKLLYQPFKKVGREGMRCDLDHLKLSKCCAILIKLWVLRRQCGTGSIYRNITVLVAFRLWALNY